MVNINALFETCKVLEVEQLLKEFKGVFCMVWGDFLSFYSWFYEVIILGGTYAISEGKMQNVSLDIELCL
jgi:hypothetical protein